jgi:hypothetical protein
MVHANVARGMGQESLLVPCYAGVLQSPVLATLGVCLLPELRLAIGGWHRLRVSAKNCGRNPPGYQRQGWNGSWTL